MSPPDDLLSRIQADAVTALKAGEKDRVRVLRTAASEIKRAAIDTGVDAVGAEAALAVLRKAVKARADAAEQFDRAARKDLADTERAEIAVLEGYLPQQTSEADVRAALVAIIAEKGLAGPAGLGTAIKEARGRLGPAADGKMVARIASELLKNS